jgi:hypothetical protein
LWGKLEVRGALGRLELGGGMNITVRNMVI